MEGKLYWSVGRIPETHTAVKPLKFLCLQCMFEWDKFKLGSSLYVSLFKPSIKANVQWNFSSRSNWPHIIQSDKQKKLKNLIMIKMCTCHNTDEFPVQTPVYIMSFSISAVMWLLVNIFYYCLLNIFYGLVCYLQLWCFGLCNHGCRPGCF